MDESHTHNNEWKKPDTKEYIVPESIYIKFKSREDNSMALE